MVSKRKQAVILVGGLGTRLRPLTFTRPKALMPILNKPMVQHIIDRLPAEFKQLIFAVSYLKTAIEQYFETHEIPDREIIIVEEREPLGTGGAIKNIEAYVDDTFIAFNGDIISSIDLDKFFRYHLKCHGIGTIALWQVDDPSRYGIVDLDSNNRILRFLEKPAPTEAFSNLINAGTYALELEIFDHIPANKVVSIEREVFPNIVNFGLFGYPFEGYWVDAGNPSAYLDSHWLLLDKLQQSVKDTIPIGYDTQLERDVQLIPPNLIGKCTKIDASTTIGPYVCIGDNVRIGKNCRISYTIIYDQATINDNVTLQNCILGSYCIIGKSTKLAPGTILGDYSKVEVC